MLPSRRPCVTDTLWWNGERYHVTVGLWPDSLEPAEIWCYGPKCGSERHILIQDVARDLSRQCQDGRDMSEVAAGALRDNDGTPLSIYGLLADFLEMHENDQY